MVWHRAHWRTNAALPAATSTAPAGRAPAAISTRNPTPAGTSVRLVRELVMVSAFRSRATASRVTTQSLRVGSKGTGPGSPITASVVGRNALHAPGQQITVRGMADVTQTDDADHPLALVDHRQPAELQLLHVMHRLCEVIIVPATMDAFGHDIARLRTPGIEVVVRKPFPGDVAVG